MKTTFLNLSILASIVSGVTAASQRSAPWCIPRGGDEGSASFVTSIPSGGAVTYASQLEAVKSQVLATASESVSSSLADPI
jgi:hypothetical protein